MPNVDTVRKELYLFDDNKILYPTYITSTFTIYLYQAHIPIVKELAMPTLFCLTAICYF